MDKGNRSFKLNAMRLLLLASIMGLWELSSGIIVPEFFVSKPSAIAKALGSWLAGGNLFFHIGITALEAFVGFLVGASMASRWASFWGASIFSPSCCTRSSSPFTACPRSRWRLSYPMDRHWYRHEDHPDGHGCLLPRVPQHLYRRAQRQPRAESSCI